MQPPTILVWRPTQASHCAIKPWAQDLEDRGYKCGSHALVGHQHESPERQPIKNRGSIDKPRPEQQTALKCSSIKLESIK